MSLEQSRERIIYPAYINYLEKLNELTNDFFLLRHGTSEANEQQIIISDLYAGTNGFGLSLKGIEEVSDAAKRAKEQGIITPDTIFVSSPFKRTLMTSQIFANEAHSGSLLVVPDLRERNFGELEGTSNEQYQRVWDQDIDFPNNRSYGAESPAQVLQRTTKLVADLEQKYKGLHKTIVMTAHGDTLQILQTGFEKISPARHRELPHLKTAELRKVILKQ